MAGGLFSMPDGRMGSIHLPAGEADYILSPGNVVTIARSFCECCKAV